MGFGRRHLVAAATAATAAVAGLVDAKSTVFYDASGVVLESAETPAFKFCTGASDTSVLELKWFEETWCADGCKGPDETVGPNTALIMPEYNEKCFNCGYAKLAAMAQKSGALSLLWFSHQEAGHEAQVVHSFAETEAADPNFLMVEVPEATCEVIKGRLDKNVTVAVVEGLNSWDEFYDTPWNIVRIILWVEAAFIIVLASWRLRFFLPVWWSSNEYKAPVFILSIELFCNVMRSFYLIDPMWAYGFFEYAPSRVLISMTIPLELVSTIVLVLAWSDMMQMAVQNSKAFLSVRSRRILVATTLVLVCTELAFSLLAAYLGQVLLSEAFSIITALFTIAVAVAILIVGRKLINLIGKYTSHGKSSHDLTTSVTTSRGDSFDYSSGSDSRLDTSMQGFEPQSQSGSKVDDEGLSVATNPGSSRGGTLKRPKRTKARNDLRFMTRKIMSLAVVLVLTALSLAAAGQDMVLFNQIPRAICFLALYGLLGVQSYFKITFFVSPRKK